tara:strand:+ start:354 stop:1580 length:1227 start_codon:yes stop_codon:yes gene_type:complete
MGKFFKATYLNDPIYGFIAIEDPLLDQIIAHPFFQRLRRIKQMGLSYLVYPGTHHTRFEHALGSLHLMQKGIHSLRKKKVAISDEEALALQAAILLHDIGHGPFSHATENIITQNVQHENISIEIIKLLNKQWKGALTLALSIFTNTYHRKFMHQLIASQIDMDRLDYLKRDSFYAGTPEGNINVDRLIAVMNVENEQLVFEKKGIYSIEKFLMARHAMYWQVYLHKTSLVAELMLVKILNRFRTIAKTNDSASNIPEALHYFLTIKPNVLSDQDTLKKYLALDDGDLMQAIKQWQYHPDYLLSDFSKRLIERQLLKIKLDFNPLEASVAALKRKELIATGIDKKNIDEIVFEGSVSNQMYVPKENNFIQIKDGKHIKSLAHYLKYLDLDHFSSPQVKYYLCYPKPNL